MIATIGLRTLTLQFPSPACARVCTYLAKPPKAASSTLSALEGRDGMDTPLMDYVRTLARLPGREWVEAGPGEQVSMPHHTSTRPGQ